MSDIKELKFDLSVIEIPVNIENKKYILREASGAAACSYRNAMIECTQLGPDGKPTKLKGIANVEPLLVSLCLFDDKNKRVPVATIQSWPSRIQKTLFDKAKEISELGEEEEEDIKSLKSQRAEIDERIASQELRGGSAKNELSDTMDGSG